MRFIVCLYVFLCANGFFFGVSMIMGLLYFCVTFPAIKSHHSYEISVLLAVSLIFSVYLLGKWWEIKENLVLAYSDVISFSMAEQ
jgi:hypothetical protein